MKTYLDAGVLIAAFRAESQMGKRAIQILDDQNRIFASSVFAQLEVLPKAIYHQQTYEIRFYEAFFDSVQYWANDLEKLVQDGYQIASQYGLSAVDALHVAAALLVGAEELVTTERRTKPMHRVPNIKITSILDD
jgi:predicted nucleic acid-binding protein